MNPPIPTLPCCVCGRPTDFMQFVLGNACSKQHYAEALARAREADMTYTLDQFREDFFGHLTFNLSEEDAKQTIAMGREACDRYERLKLMDLYNNNLQGMTKAQVVDRLNQLGVIHGSSKYFKEASHEHAR